MSQVRKAGLAAIALATIFIIIGFAISNDFLGLLFMISLLAGLVLVGIDFLVQRRRPSA